MNNIEFLQLCQAASAARAKGTPIEKMRQYVEQIALRGVLSNRAISAITGVSMRSVGDLTNKTDSTGGRFAPASLAALIGIATAIENDERPDRGDVLRALSLGTSPLMVERLTGMPRRTVLDVRLRQDASS